MLQNNDDYKIASTKSEQLRALLPHILKKEDDSELSPLEELAQELAEDIAYAIRRLR